MAENGNNDQNNDLKNKIDALEKSITEIEYQIKFLYILSIPLIIVYIYIIFNLIT